MNIYPTYEYTTCPKFSPDYQIGFRIITMASNEKYTREDTTCYNLIFVLEGEIELSYINVLKQRLCKYELFLVPICTETYITAQTDVRLLILTSDHKTETVCDNCTLYNHSRQKIEEEYIPHALQMTPQIIRFSELMEDYILSQTHCCFIDQLKLKELFAILPYNYSSKELSYFFYPVVSSHISFRTKVLEASQAGLSIHEIAANVGMSSRTFSRKFMDEFGEPARFWMLKQKAKIIKCKLLLPETTIADIIAEYNFTDLSHFTKFCKEYYGCTPSELLKKYRSDNA